MEALKRRQQQVEEQKKKTEVRDACFVPFCDFLTYVNFLNLFCTRLWSFIEMVAHSMDVIYLNYIHSKW